MEERSKQRKKKTGFPQPRHENGKGEICGCKESESKEGEVMGRNRRISGLKLFDFEEAERRETRSGAAKFL